MVGGQAVNRNIWGLRPQTPRIYRFRAKIWSGLGERVGLAPDQIPAPRSALRSHPCVALSSAQARSSIGPERRSHKGDEATRLWRIGQAHPAPTESRQAAKAISRILFHLPCTVVMEPNSGKGTGTR